MGLEVYYPQDIRNALLAAEQANSAALVVASGEEDEFAQGYQEGYRAALTTIALAFGLLRPATVGLRPDSRPESLDWQPVFLPTTRRRNGKNEHSR